ncbi:ubiquinone biosynthesis accessory factor UbiJ [Aurantivibrio plasticivorans]
MIDPSIQSAACVAIEAAINTALRYDPGTRQGLAGLSGQVLAVEVSPPGAQVYLVPGETKVSVLGQYEGDVSTRVKGSPQALLALMRSRQLNLAESGVEVFGNTGLLIQLAFILGALDIDWEEALNDIVGEVIGHTTADTIRRTLGWARERKQSFTRLLGEYVTEELRSTPAQPELHDFYSQVDELQLAADRLGAKLEQIRKKRDQDRAAADAAALDNFDSLDPNSETKH